MHTTNCSAEEIIFSNLAFSRYAKRLLESEPNLRTELLQNIQHVFLEEEMQVFLNLNSNTINNETALHSTLRRLRKRVILRLMMRDLSGLATLAEVMTSMTNLAQITVRFALNWYQTWLTDPSRYGLPKGAKSREIQKMLIISMGKLGGGELNVSSDIDLIFLYPEDGETNGTKSISNHDFFSRLGRKLIASLNDITADGYVFRVDMRLRPYGESGPLVMSFSMLEEYFLKQGREWERYAWIKSRAITGSSTEESILTEQIIKPFVFRRYLDFSAYESMRSMHAQIRQEVGHREAHSNIKLGHGGIREIEFIVQVFQLINGGRDAELRAHATIATLQCLQKKKELSDKVVTELTDAYYFLRNLEHRLQYLDDRQTQILPEDSLDQTLIAAAMGFPSYVTFLQQLNIHRNNVALHFEQILSSPQKHQTKSVLACLWQELSQDGDKDKSAIARLDTMGFSQSEKILKNLQEFRLSARYRHLPASSQEKIDALIPIIIEISVKFPPADVTLERIMRFLESIIRRAPYLALLIERPQALEQVIKFVSISQWAGEYLSQHPILLDELLNPSDSAKAPDWPTLKTELIQQLNGTKNSGKDDTEQKMDILRHFHHTQVFQLLARDLRGLLSLETLSDFLTDLADLILDVVLNLTWLGLKKRHLDIPTFAIIGYGKLGGKELGYVSDLDIIFLYDDTHLDAPEIYAKLGQRINSWLTNYTSAGFLYKTDLRLRPNGASGLLVTSINAFQQYQQQQAWVWEHQALTRARFVAGDKHVGKIFEQTRIDILRQQRNLKDLRHDILIMRQKMLDSHPNKTKLFDIKHDRGGIIDVEFIVQYLVLGYACDYPALTNNTGNIALLELAGELQLIPMTTAKKVSDAYREFRRVQHQLRLNNSSSLVETDTTGEDTQISVRVETDYLQNARTAVLHLWAELFNS